MLASPPIGQASCELGTNDIGNPWNWEFTAWMHSLPVGLRPLSLLLGQWLLSSLNGVKPMVAFFTEWSLAPRLTIQGPSRWEKASSASQSAFCARFLGSLWVAHAGLVAHILGFCLCLGLCLCLCLPQANQDTSLLQSQSKELKKRVEQVSSLGCSCNYHANESRTAVSKHVHCRVPLCMEHWLAQSYPWVEAILVVRHG